MKTFTVEGLCPSSGGDIECFERTIKLRLTYANGTAEVKEFNLLPDESQLDAIERITGVQVVRD